MRRALLSLFACVACSSPHEAASTSSAALTTVTPAGTELLVVDNARLFGVATDDAPPLLSGGSDASTLGADDWSGVGSLASLQGSAFAVVGASLYKIDPVSGARAALGSPVWPGTSLLASYDEWLYAIQGAGLYRINPTDGSYTRVGTGDWTGTSALTGDTVDDLYLYAVQGAGLWRIDFYAGTWSRVGTGDWTGTKVLAGYRGALYAVQGPELYRVNIQDGSWARLGSRDWTGTVALVSDTRRLYAIQGGTLFSIDPMTGDATQMTKSDWSGATAMTVAVASKTRKSVVIPFSALKSDLENAMGNTYLRLDQTGDPSHALQVTARHSVCVAASASAIAKCRAKCVTDDTGDPNLLKACEQSCTALQVCTDVCDSHMTANYILFGQPLKTAAKETCQTTGQSCPPCIVGNDTSGVEDLDISDSMPVPTFQTVVADNPLSCMLQTFGIALDNDATGVVQTIDTNDYHLDIPGFTSDPTLVCTNGINPTITNPHFLFDFTPHVVNHHPSLAVVANFSGHVDYAFDWIYSLDTTLSNRVGSMINGAAGKLQGKLDKQFENYLVKKIGEFAGDTEIDDWIDVRATPDGISITYTTSCENGVCSCTADCGSKTCGTDQHCGDEVCGTCGAGQHCDDGAGACVCTPQCDGKKCGDDGCGGTCGDCGAGGECLANNTCCTPQCSGKTCGPDGCGGSCGTCSIGDVCTANGTCQCIPRTTCNGQCGMVDDGCGGWLSCGGCAAGFTCQGNRCTTCVPSCAGKRCGAANGCGGRCSGTCGKVGYVCTDDGEGDYYCQRGD